MSSNGAVNPMRVDFVTLVKKQTNGQLHVWLMFIIPRRKSRTQSLDIADNLIKDDKIVPING